MQLIVAVFAGVMGAAMAGIWARDILAGHGFDAPDGLLRAREADTDNLMIWHWLAEFGTAGVLVFGGFLLLLDAALAVPVTLVGMGALAYTAANSLGWSLALPERRSYALPMLVGLVGSLICIAILLFWV
jgi:hypothetical protein